MLAFEPCTWSTSQNLIHSALANYKKKHSLGVA